MICNEDGIIKVSIIYEEPNNIGFLFYKTLNTWKIR